MTSKPSNYTPDGARTDRIGFGEAILCDSKHVAHLGEIMSEAFENERSLLLTRLDEEKFEGLAAAVRENTDYDPVSRTAWFGTPPAIPATATVGIVTAGTSDIPVAREAARTLGFNGIACEEIYDVGVAGIWRLMDRVDQLREFKIVIAAAGMDAALPSVLGGLIPGMIIAIPTSVGYGVAKGGSTALNAILASCAPGICVVNIDNGYGAACAAMRAHSAIFGASGTETK